MMTRREWRALRREWRKTVARSAELSRWGCNLLSEEAWQRALVLEAKIKEYEK